MTRQTDRAPSEEMAARYGRPSVAGHRAGIVVIAIVVIALLGWLVWAALGQARDTVGGLVQSYEVQSPHQMSVTVQITRTTTETVDCTVTAVASDHSVVGQRVVRLAVGPSGTRTLTTTVRTEREATSANVANCR